LPVQEEYKYLGVKIQETGKSYKKLDEIIQEISKMSKISIMRRIAISTKHKVDLWKTYFYSKSIYFTLPILTASETVKKKI